MPSRRAEKRLFRPMPVWLRGGDVEEIFTGALWSLDSATDTVEFYLRSAWPADNPERRLHEVRSKLQMDLAFANDVNHSLDNAFDALDVVIGADHRRNEAETLLRCALSVRAALVNVDLRRLAEGVHDYRAQARLIRSPQ